ncbi:hypothetical protein QJR60_17245 (plasmid) [Paraclostridium sordellii]|uniref:hypothetical protein n=1 Tax=Paraclostridium sordellii TaxID=1505 RepID=UPI0030CC3A10
MENFLNYFVKNIESGKFDLLGFGGSILGLIGAYYIASYQIRKQKKIDEKKSIDKLMYLLLYTYRWINLFTYGNNANLQLKALSSNEFYTSIVYDNNWRDYISCIDDYKDTEVIVKWFFKIENKIVVDSKKVIEHSLELENILKKYGYEKELVSVKEEILKSA